MHSDSAHFDPIAASNNLKSGFIDYITTTFHIADHSYKTDFVKELEKPGFLTKGPFLDMNGSYKTGRSLRQLMEAGLASAGFDTLEPIAEKDRELKIERPLYLHQEQALLKADAGNNLIVTTGTGSGKTECFLLPILQALLREEEDGPLDSGVRAILIEFLTRSNVLPKYGFPVDTVELQIGTSASSRDDGLQLSRDLQMAIAEYAPGAEVIADGRMYTSRYIRKAGSRGKSDSGFEYGYYAQCPSCKENNFTDNPLARRVGLNCISCEKKIPKNRWNRTIEPRLGFIAENPNGKEVPMHKPERDYKTEDYYVGDGRHTILKTQEFKLGSEVLRLQSTKNDSLAVVGLGEHIVCPLCGYATDKDEPVLAEKHKNARGYECSYRSNGLPQVPVRLSHVFKTDVASIAFLTADAADDKTMVSVMYAILEGLSKELDIERTDIKGCLHRIKWEGSGQPIYSIILYDAVAGGAGHVRRIVTEDGHVFEHVLRRAYETVNDCKCDPSCYSCIRNYYNQKIHDKLDRKKAAAFLRQRLVPCVPIQEQNTQQSLEFSGGEPATQYPTWEELYSVSCFEQDGAALDALHIPREDCLVMPDMKSVDQSANPYLVWMKEKVILFDELDEDWKQITTDAGWKADTMDIAPEKLENLLRGVD